MTTTRPELKNIRKVLCLERESQGHVTPLDRLTQRISRHATGAAFIVIHVAWFVLWIAWNAQRGSSFDPSPFNLLNLAVSLEAIVLTAFVLRAQSRMALQADKRAQLDLQINLLAEEELTVILRVLCAVGEHAGIDLAACDSRVEQFRSQTDVRAIADGLETERRAAAP